MRNAYCLSILNGEKVVTSTVDKWASLVSGPDAVQEIMWQKDLSSVAKFNHHCLNKVNILAAGPSHDGQASDQPYVAERDACPLLSTGCISE